MKNVLITGINGFVGSNLVLALKDNYTIYGLDIINPRKDGVINTYSWNDLNRFDLPHFDIIIHLAGKAHDIKKKVVEKTYFTINTGLTQRIFDFFLASSAKKFIFFSSVKAAVDRVENGILTEEVIPAPVGPYGESKIEAEKYIISLCDRLELESKHIYILRPCMIHGPGNKGNLNLLYNIVRRGIPWPLGTFNNKRSFTSIDNLCYVIDGLISKDVPSGIYHMADDEALSTNELIKVMCKGMGKKPTIWKLNRSLMIGFAKIGTFLHLPLNSERLQKLTENYVVSNQKIKKALNIEKMPISAEDGLTKTIKSFISSENN